MISALWRIGAGAGADENDQFVSPPQKRLGRRAANRAGSSQHTDALGRFHAGRNLHRRVTELRDGQFR